ncbi:hypothetical protein Gpo141_00010314 [Globisporangium polare]
MASTTSSSRRELAALLMDSQSVGIAAIVQERVHSTSIGVASTADFLQQLVQELEDATAEYLVLGAQALEHEQEVELGSLITASSLSVRYVTEREAMLPLLSRFRAVFSTVLRFDAWGKGFIGLKAVALMASTRVLEAFGAEVSSEDVEQELQWLLELFVPPQENELQWLMDLFAPQDAELSVQKADYLLRPTCEFISVATQTHESANEMIYSKILSQLLTLVQRFGDEYSGEVRVSDAALNELVSTIAALLDAKLPPAASNVFASLPMPSFVEEIEGSDAPARAIAATKDEDASEDDEDASPLKFSNGDSSVYQCVAVLCGWLNTSGRRTSASVVLPVLCHSIYLNDPEQNNTDMVATIVDSLLSSLRDLELNNVLDFEYVNVILESLRDVAQRVKHFKADLVSAMYNELRAVMPRLETALKATTVEKEELQSIKQTCSKVRQTLVEAFLAWIYNAGATNFATHQEDFFGETSTKLADPRIYGDVIHVVRKGATADETEVSVLVEKCALLLTQALKQLDRYSKTTASHIVSAVTRVASSSGKFVAPRADDLALPLLVSILDGSCKGKSLRSRLEAVACVLLGSSESEAFQPEEHIWVAQFAGALLEKAESESAHTLAIIASLIRASPLLLAQVATVCGQKSQAVGAIFHDSLSRWPLFEEDIDGVILTLEILAALLGDSSFRALLDPATIASTVQKLSENAKSDELDLVVAACSDVLASDFFKSDAVQ